jgi:hypothetical protein
MQPLAERAAAVVRRLSGPAVPLPELVRLLRESGIPVSGSVLLRALAAEPERFRVLEPCRALRRAGRLDAPSWDALTWVVPAAAPEPRDPPDPQRPALRKLRTSLVRLGWQVDPHSSTDVARWFGMVLEAARFRAALQMDTPQDRATETTTDGGGRETSIPRPRPRPRTEGPVRSWPRRGRPTPRPESH